MACLRHDRDFPIAMSKKATPKLLTRADGLRIRREIAAVRAVVASNADAIAVIVSEETGSISLAVAGTIERDLTVDQLRERMGELLRRYVPPTVLPTPMTNGASILDETEEEMPIRTSDQHSKPGAQR